LLSLQPHEKHAAALTKDLESRAQASENSMTTHGAHMTAQQHGWRYVVRFVSVAACTVVQAPSASLITRNDAKREPSGLRGDPA